MSGVVGVNAWVIDISPVIEVPTAKVVPLFDVTLNEVVPPLLYVN